MKGQKKIPQLLLDMCVLNGEKRCRVSFSPSHVCLLRFVGLKFSETKRIFSGQSFRDNCLVGSTKQVTWAQRGVHPRLVLPALNSNAPGKERFAGKYSLTSGEKGTQTRPFCVGVDGTGPFGADTHSWTSLFNLCFWTTTETWAWILRFVNLQPVSLSTQRGVSLHHQYIFETDVARSSNVACLRECQALTTGYQWPVCLAVWASAVRRGTSLFDMHNPRVKRDGGE